jgi:SAM-dependent methyltransferase
MVKSDFLNYWNSLYSKDNFFGSGPTKLAKLAQELLLKENVTRILEIGCGQGRDATYLSQLGYHVDAFDLSENAVNYVNKAKNIFGLDNLNVFVHDATKELNYPNGHFDFIYSNLALQFFELDAFSNILSNISQIMKNNSKFLLSTKKEGDKYYQTGKKISDFAYENKGIIRYFYPIETLEKIFNKFFNIISIEHDSHKNLDSTVSVWWKILLEKRY